MTEKEYEALYEALEAAHKILPGAKECDAKDSELRKKANGSLDLPWFWLIKDCRKTVDLRTGV